MQVAFSSLSKSHQGTSETGITYAAVASPIVCMLESYHHATPSSRARRRRQQCRGQARSRPVTLQSDVCLLVLLGELSHLVGVDTHPRSTAETSASIRSLPTEVMSLSYQIVSNVHRI